MYNKIKVKNGGKVVDLLQLKYFYESAGSGSLSKTAKKYMVPLTSVSASIRRLEAELGCKLFDRFPNYVVLNENGKELQKTLSLVFAEIDGVVGRLSSVENGIQEIKILVRAMRRKVTDLVLEFNKLYPHCSFKISFDFDETNDEEYDIVIDEDNECYSDYRKIEIFTAKLRIKCAKNHRLVGRKVTMRQLSGEQFLSMGKKSNMHKALLRVCERSGFTPEISVFCNDLECYEKLLSGGQGIAIGIETTENSDISFLDVTDLDERYTVYCHCKPNCEADVVGKFLDFVNLSRF